MVTIWLPPLRDRQGDIPLLAQHFLKRYRQKHGKPIKGFSQSALNFLSDYSWPGNVRELENAIERAVILEDGEYIGPQIFRHMLALPTSPPKDAPDLDSLPTLKEVEDRYIMEVLQATQWNRKKASQILGISTVTLWRKFSKS